MINELDKSSFNNIENQSMEFVMHTLRPWIKRLEQSISRDLIVASDRNKYFAEFKIDGLLRGDTKSRYEAYGKAINDGWLSPNEVRAFENLNKADGLDEYRVPLNMGNAGDEPQEQEPAPQPQQDDEPTPQDKEMLVLKIERERAKDKESFIEKISDYYDRKGFETWQKKS